MKTVVKIITENYKLMDYIHFGAWLEENIEPLLEKEKQQIIDFGNDLLAQQDSNYIAMPDLAEQYYNQTFKD